MKILEKILNSARVLEINSKNETILSIEKRFYEEMLSYFKDVVDSHSTGKRMIFHMGYIVWFEPSDYNTLKDELLAIIPEVIEGFYDIIKERKNVYPNCIPSSLTWSIQATPTNVLTQNNADTGLIKSLVLKKGDFIISSTFHSIGRIASNVHQQANVTLSFRPQNSNTMKDMDVNKDLLLGIETICGVFTRDFDFKKAELNVARSEVCSTQGYATLKYSLNGADATYVIKGKSLFVSGPNDVREQNNVLVLPDENITTGHLFFRYVETEDYFEVAAYGYTVLNERVLKLSEPGEPIWYRVSTKASFLLGSGFGLKFNQILV